MVWHDDKTVEPYPFVVDHELQAVHQNIFALIGQQQRLPVEAGGCEKFNTLMHALSYEKKVGEEKRMVGENTDHRLLIWGKEMYEADGITSKKDVNNTDEKLQKRNLKDLILLTDFVFEWNSWSGGKIYDPKGGKTYSCNMKLNGTVLDIRGYVGISLFGHTSQWTRVK